MAVEMPPSATHVARDPFPTSSTGRRWADLAPDCVSSGASVCGGRVSEPTASVVVVTYERPTYLARCLDHLAAQTTPPFEIIVVDSSAGRETAELVAEHHPTVDYVVCAAGGGATATARDIGYRRTTGEIVAFIDDDAFAERTWLARLLSPLRRPLPSAGWAAVRSGVSQESSPRGWRRSAGCYPTAG